MKNSLNFLIKANELKETQRTGWGIWRIKNPETIAEHTFRVCFLSFLLGRKKGLNAKTAILDALIHDLCEVYAGDSTPFFYYQNLDIRKKEDKKILLKGIRLSGKEKEKRSAAKLRKEKKALFKLAAPLEECLRNEISLRWLDYEYGFSPEGKFVKQIDWVENLIQSLEYLGPKKSGSGWWEIAEEKVWDPLLLDFLGIVQNKFYHKEHKKNKELEGTLDFIGEIGKLKRMPRLYWKMRGIKNPETIAGHTFTLMLLVLIFSARKKQLDTEKLLKMALCHEITAVYTKDTTPYDINFPDGRKELVKILEKAPYSSEDKKTKKFIKDYRNEEKAIKKLTSKLPISSKEEIIQLWEEYRSRRSSESRLLAQLNVLAILLQGLLYKKSKKNFSVKALWEWVFENCDDPLIITLMDEMEKKL